MGILAEPLQFIRELKLPPGFSVCELGDQFITHGVRRLAADVYRDELRCGRYVSIDGNGRNGAVAYDLNEPLPRSIGTFDLVTDFGTGEHVFNQWQVFKTIHELIRKKGFFVFDRPTQGYEANGGHCYFNVHECVFNDFAAANFYKVLRLERQATKRGELLRGVMQKTRLNNFVTPQQGRYAKLLRPIITTSQQP